MNISEMGKFIASQRKKLGMSQKEVADYLHITDKAVSKWERGLACPDADNLQRLSVLFSCSVSEIIGGALRDVNATSNRFESSPRQNDEENYASDVLVTIDQNSNRYISPYLFGDNLEHTRDCVNGGISAQMLKNRKFVGKPGRYGCAEGWRQIGEKTYLTFTESYTCHGEGYRMKRSLERNSQSVTSFSSEKAGIGQSGIYIKENTVYDFAAVLKAFSPVTVTVELCSGSGEIYDSQAFSVDCSDFKRFTLELKSSKTDDNATLCITFCDRSTLTIGALSLMPKDNFHGMRWDVINCLKELSVKVLRWPGGNFAGEYHWLDGLLDADERSPFQSYMWLETQPHTLGYDFHEINTDDFIALCREIGAQPFITINPTWNTPEESAAWVEYCNGDETTQYGKLRIERGYKEPYNVQFWSLGNEFGYGHMEGANTPYEYAKTVGRHGHKMLEKSPNLTLCSSGPYPNEDWVKHSAKALADIAPVVSMHNYPDYPKWIDPAKYKQEYYYLFSEINNYFIKNLNELRAQLGNDRIKISLDEWNVWYAWYRISGVYEGIYAAAFMNAVLEQADKNGILIACHFESVNEGAISVYPDKAVLNPAGVAMSLMAKHADGKVLALQKDVVITQKDGRITCTLINRSYDKEKRFELLGLGKLLEGVLYSSEELHPGTVFVKEKITPAEERDRLTFIAPPHSIIQLVFQG